MSASFDRQRGVAHLTVIESEASYFSAMSLNVTAGFACHHSLTLLHELPCSADVTLGKHDVVRVGITDSQGYIKVDRATSRGVRLARFEVASASNLALRTWRPGVRTVSGAHADSPILAAAAGRIDWLRMA